MAVSSAALPAPPRRGLVPTFAAPAHWQAIDFISDLHLAEATPRAFDAWAAHLRHTQADAVFILGDLFDLWVGDDAATTGFEARCLSVLAEAGQRVTIAFMAGNRDFLIGDSLLERLGVMRLVDPTLVTAFGGSMLATHGDALCVGDVAYQRYRRFIDRPAVRRVFALLPLRARHAIGAALRRRSGMRPAASAQNNRIDVDGAEVSAWMEAAGVPTLVHGHTHLPASHALADGRARHVLTDWELDDSTAPRAEVLRWDASGLHRIAPETGGP